MINPVYPDSETAVETWLKANTAVRSAVTTYNGKPSIFHTGSMPNLPEDPNNKQFQAALPMLTFYRAGGNPQYPIDVPIDDARISFACYGGNRHSARNLATVLIQESSSLTGYTSVGPVVVNGAKILVGPIWNPDPRTSLACYWVDIQFTTQAITG